MATQAENQLTPLNAGILLGGTLTFPNADRWPAAQPLKLFHLTQAMRDQSDKQIARIMGLAIPTIRTYLQRIGVRMGTCGRMQLAMRVLEVSHQVGSTHKCR